MKNGAWLGSPRARTKTGTKLMAAPKARAVDSPPSSTPRPPRRSAKRAMPMGSASASAATAPESPARKNPNKASTPNAPATENNRAKPQR